MPWLLDSFGLPSYGSNSRKRYTLKLLLMFPGAGGVWSFGSCSSLPSSERVGGTMIPFDNIRKPGVFCFQEVWWGNIDLKWFMVLFLSDLLDKMQQVK